LKQFITILFVFCLVEPAFTQNRYINGIVRDAETKDALSGCSLANLHGRAGTTTDALGQFTLPIPYSTNQNIFFIVSFTGYKTDTVTITNDSSAHIIFLHPLRDVLDEVIVTTGVSKATIIKENPVSIVTVSARKMDRNIESNLVDVLVKNVPGLNAVKTGPNISKPFIRGLGYNRVLTLYDGIRQEGQQWGDEHGIEADAYNIEKAEVIKGPASLLFGSDALAGVVSLIPPMPNQKDSRIHGRFVSEYQSNNGLIGNGLRLNYSNDHFLWALRGSFRVAKNYTNDADGRVYNTGFDEKNLSALFGYTTDKGYSHLNFTLYENLQGIPDGSRDSISRKFTKQVNEVALDELSKRPIVPESALNSYTLSPLHQHIQHYRLYSKNHYQLGKGLIDILFGLQQNIRREYNHPTDIHQAGLFVKLNTINYGINYSIPFFEHIDFTVGANGMYQNNQSKNGTDFPIPNYNLFDVGTYAHAKWKYKKWTISGGIRYDTRNLRGKDLYIATNHANGFEHQVFLPDTTGARKQFSTFQKNFSGISLSLGGTLQVTEQISIKANIARGYRSPSITELASNGLDPGAHIIYLGNKNFEPEFSLEQDIGVIAEFRDISASVSIFNNSIENYIYLSQLADAQGNPVVDPQGNKTFQYQQASAWLYGVEASLDIHPSLLKGFQINSNFSFVRGYNLNKEFKNHGTNGEYLPFIPPMKLLSSVSQEIKPASAWINAINIKADIEYNADQNRYMGLYHTETFTPGYTLLNMSAGISINCSKKSIMQFQLQVNNIFDIVYQSNLSRLKYFEYYSSSPNGRSGIYGMGRNICGKVIMNF
jgi:iron complex outermembrane receptor protein